MNVSITTNTVPAENATNKENTFVPTNFADPKDQDGGAKEAPSVNTKDPKPLTTDDQGQENPATATTTVAMGGGEKETETPNTTNNPEKAITNDDVVEAPEATATTTTTRPSIKSSKDTMTSATQALRAIWEMSQQGNGNANAFQQAIQVLMKTYDESILQPAIRAMMELENAKKENTALQKIIKNKDRELERLKQSEKESKKSIANLMKAVETSNQESEERVQAKLVEAKLRADFLHANQQRNEALQQAEEHKVRVDHIKNDLDHYKQKAHKLQVEKAQKERELCTTRGMLTNMNGSASHDVDYHKRKADEANTYLKSAMAQVARKDREIAEIRKERDRLYTQNQLAQLKQQNNGGFSMGGSNKKARHSF